VKAQGTELSEAKIMPRSLAKLAKGLMRHQIW